MFAASRSFLLLAEIKLSRYSGKNVVQTHCIEEAFVNKKGNFTENSSQEKQYITTSLNESRTDDLCSKEQKKGK